MCLCVLASRGERETNVAVEPGADAAVGGVSVMAATPTKNRVSILLDSSGSMLITPQIVTFRRPASPTAGTAARAAATRAPHRSSATRAWRGRSAPRRRARPTSTAACRTTTATAGGSSTAAPRPPAARCSTSVDGVPTRGDGNALTPGLRRQRRRQANDSRLYQAKDAVSDVIATFGEVEFSLWRYAQVERRPDLQRRHATARDTGRPASSHVRDRRRHQTLRPRRGLPSEAPTGQCSTGTWNGADSTFSCGSCSDNGGERLLCEAYALDQIRTGGTQPARRHGQLRAADDRPPVHDESRRVLVQQRVRPQRRRAPGRLSRPPASTTTTYRSHAWIDHQQPNLATDVEIKACGRHADRRIAARHAAAVLSSAQLDTKTAVSSVQGGHRHRRCRDLRDHRGDRHRRRHVPEHVVHERRRRVVPDYDVPVYVIGFAICPPSQPAARRAPISTGSPRPAAPAPRSSPTIGSSSSRRSRRSRRLGRQRAVQRQRRRLRRRRRRGLPGPGLAVPVGVGQCFATARWCAPPISSGSRATRPPALPAARSATVSTTTATASSTTASRAPAASRCAPCGALRHLQRSRRGLRRPIRRGLRARCVRYRHGRVPGRNHHVRVGTEYLQRKHRADQ